MVSAKELLKDYFLGARTRKTLESLARNHLLPALARTENPEALVNVWIGAELSPATIKKLLGLYRKWHSQKYPNKAVPNLSRVYRKINRLDKSSPKFWTKAEAEKAINVAKAFGPEIYLYILLGLHCGMRPGEIRSLKWECVDFISGTIYVVTTEGATVTKTGNFRTVKVTRLVEEALLALYEPGDEGVIFRRSPERYLGQVCKYAQVPSITPQGLRHSFATMALEARRSPRQVASVLGHSKVSTTLNMYWQYRQEEMDTDFLPGEKNDT